VIACSVFMLDELDLLVTKKQRVLYNFFDWSSQVNSKLVVVGISNTVNLPESLPAKVYSRMGMWAALLSFSTSLLSIRSAYFLLCSYFLYICVVFVLLLLCSCYVVVLVLLLFVAVVFVIVIVVVAVALPVVFVSLLLLLLLLLCLLSLFSCCCCCFACCLCFRVALLWRCCWLPN